MELIERLLVERGQQVTHAVTPAGDRVRPDAAYLAPAPARHIAPRDRVAVVECDPVLPKGMRPVSIDHHRPGDPGYGRAPIDFLPASSLGQVWLRLAELGQLGVQATAPDHMWTFFAQDANRWILRMVAKRGVLFTDQRDLEAQVRDAFAARRIADVPIPREHVLAAAADHCLAAAYRGECPGVNPDDLMRWRIETRAAHQRRPVAEVLADIERARQALRDAPRTHIDSFAVADLTAVGTVPELPEAAAREGIPFLARLEEHGRTKLVLQAAPARVVVDWLEQQRLLGRKPYGDPERGFAGVVLT